VDFRDGLFGKAQLLLTPAANWEARLIYSGERARDGDYALNDLDALRANPFHTSRDFEGHTNRDVHRDHVPGAPRRREVHVRLDDRLRPLEDRRSHGPGLLAAAARHARQQRRGRPVHPGIPLRVGTGRRVKLSDAATLNGRPVSSCSHRTTTRKPSTISRRG
jgi:hypothetical protein